MKKLISVFCLVFALITVFALPAGAARTYQTYTYSIDGFALHSPDAYTPIKNVSSADMGLEELALDGPHDIVVDEKDNVYIADTGNSRIVVLDRYFKFRFEIMEFINDQGINDKLNKPQGVFVTKDIIYVCDTDQNRIVTFDKEGNFIKIIPQPKSSLFDENAVYKPVAMAVDDYNRLYVVSSTTYQGIIVMSEDGTFIRFVGAQKVAISAWDRIWRMFQTKDQRELSVANISTEFNNITIDEKGFIYVTTNTISESKVRGAITGKSKSGDYAPVKMLNQSGEEVMARNGFWPPAGEIDLSGRASEGATTGVSSIIDVAIGPEHTWSIIDEKRQKIFTYDDNGNLLFAFGDMGEQIGNIAKITGIAYQGSKMLVLDSSNDCFVVYNRTEYGDMLINALQNDADRRYDLATSDWTDILQRNNNYSIAYLQLGRAAARDGDYDTAMGYFERIKNTVDYSAAFAEVRSAWAKQNFWIIPVAIVVIAILVVKFFSYAGKVNKRATLKIGRRSLKEEVLYAFHVIFHPFDGFWDLKHEKRGSMKSAFVLLIFTIIAFFYKSVGTAYIHNPGGTGYMSVVGNITAVVVPLLLWVIANWCFTTLFEGEGSMKDIFISTCYSLTPLPILMIPAVILTNFLTLEEAGIIALLNGFAFIWMGLLLVLGTMITHDYSLGKNVLTCIVTVVGMAFIMFIVILFSTLLTQIVGFISKIAVEMSFRM